MILISILSACTSPPMGGPNHSATRPNALNATIGQLGWLHVAHPPGQLPYLADESGRSVILKGVAASGFEDQDFKGARGSSPNYPINPAAYEGKCPIDNGLAPDPPLCEVQASKSAISQSSAAGSNDDFAQMRAYGFDVVRLTLNWSLLEPTPGHYSKTYLDRIAQVVQWAKQQGIYVLLDMHQDQYSRFLTTASAGVPNPPGCNSSNGQDGAPEWAVITDGKPSCALLGQNELNPAMAAAFQNFWDNSTLGTNGTPIPQGSSPGPGLEDHYIGAIAALARRFQNNSAVVGYEIMNEPLPGALQNSAVPVSNLYSFSDNQLIPFYAKAIEAITGVRDGMATCPATEPSGNCAYPPLAHVNRQSIFFEPTGYNNLVDFAPQKSTVFSHYENLVFAPHIYTHVFTADTFPSATGVFPPSYDFGYSTATAEAEAMNAALLPTEYGDSPSTDTTILAGMTSAQDRAMVGSIFWTWKENCGSNDSSNCQNGWGVYAPPATDAGVPVSQNGSLYQTRIDYLQRIRPVFTSGHLQGITYDPAAHSFEMVANSNKSVRLGDRSNETVIVIPPLSIGSGRVVQSVTSADSASHSPESNISATVNITGAAKLDQIITEASSGGTLVYVAPTGRGSYSVEINGFASSTSAQAQAQEWSLHIMQFDSQLTNPLLPITETKARSAFDSWVGSQISPVFSAEETLLLGPPSSDPNAS